MGLRASHPTVDPIDIIITDTTVYSTRYIYIHIMNTVPPVSTSQSYHQHQPMHGAICSAVIHSSPPPNGQSGGACIDATWPGAQSNSFRTLRDMASDITGTQGSQSLKSSASVVMGHGLWAEAAANSSQPKRLNVCIASKHHCTKHTR